MGWHSLCEHVLSGRIISSGACEADKFHCPIIRVWYCPPQEQCGLFHRESDVLYWGMGAVPPCSPGPFWHVMCQHALSGRMTASGACGDNRLHIPAIRVYKRKKKYGVL